MRNCVHDNGFKNSGFWFSSCFHFARDMTKQLHFLVKRDEQNEVCCKNRRHTHITWQATHRTEDLDVSGEHMR